MPCRVPKEDLGRFLDEAPSMGIKGLSVTIPHKEAVIEKLTEVDAAVRGIGAANTVIFADGQRRGYNTDYQAAMDSLEIRPGRRRRGVGKHAQGEDRPGAGLRRRRQGHFLRPDPPRRQPGGHRRRRGTGQATGRPLQVPLGGLGACATRSPPR